MASLRAKEIFCLLYSTLLFVSGIALIGLSIVLSYKLFYHYKFVPNSTICPFIIILLLGFVHLFLTWLGVRGPTREHDFHIILFMIITLILLIIELFVGIWSVVLWDEVDVESVQIMTDSFNELVKNGYYKKDWARMERQLKCCGLNGIDDYNIKDKNFIPYSCCDLGTNMTNCPIFEMGCKKPMTKYVKWILIDGAILGFVACILQILGIFTFYTFFKALKKERSERISRRLEMQRRMSRQNPDEPSNNNPNISHPQPITTTSS